MANKITKVQMFGMIKALGEVASHPEMVEFIDHEIELLEKKASGKKPTKTQAENESIKASILNVLTADMTATQVMNEVDGGYSIQKITALLGQLEKAGKVTKHKDKKTTLFSLVEMEDETE